MSAVASALGVSRPHLALSRQPPSPRHPGADRRGRPPVPGAGLLAAIQALIADLPTYGYPPAFVRRLKERGIAWWANVSTVAEARAAEEAGADVVVAQGMEAGGHRGCFDAARAEAGLVGLFALVPAIADAVRIPVVATGGIADPRGVAAALLLGASAVQVGTGFLRCPEAELHPAWADALSRTLPEGTALTRAFSGRLVCSVATAYVRAAAAEDAPLCTPYPVQRGLTQAMREAAGKLADFDRMQAWVGQAAARARAAPQQRVTNVVARCEPSKIRLLSLRFASTGVA